MKYSTLFNICSPTVHVISLYLRIHYPEHTCWELYLKIIQRTTTPTNTESLKNAHAVRWKLLAHTQPPMMVAYQGGGIMFASYILLYSKNAFFSERTSKKRKFERFLANLHPTIPTTAIVGCDVHV